MKKFLGLPILDKKIPYYTGMLFNFGVIALFSMIPTILILWLVFDQFQNGDNPTTFINYAIAALIGLIVQHVVRVLLNIRFPMSYSHWTNGAFMVLLFLIGYLTSTEKFGF